MKVALVTGCGKRDGMGQAIARTLAAEKIAVVVSDRLPGGVPNQRQERLGRKDEWTVESLVAAITAEGGTASAVTGDIGAEEDARRMIDEAVSRHGRLDILVNNAAAPQGPDRQDIEDVPIDVWDQVIRINLRGTYLMSRFAVPVMRAQRWGRIVNIASMAGLSAAPAAGAYSASKAGVIGLTRSLAMDLGPWGVTVNAICPGLVGTSRAVLNPDPALDDQEVLAQRGNAISVGRVGMPEDIAAAVRYLASEEAGYVTAQTLILDGGGFSRFPSKRPAPPS
ncbi:SDR family NAD(P)-dependent oxidoreductase [Amycolatopsis alkalitolerans]|uniref:SDR family oxidoreductase n=1 Tax=Amycolatopsis alkalitolerans TaxID=2547244 RepID=A0A5C4LP12_9PSEU|nr:SDR family oxidoreductase [Amycolatopsis alkalitolerans]TNC18852.1 SDR family oxidoreductase [Amycolatopsis alkalitolerans]